MNYLSSNWKRNVLRACISRTVKLWCKICDELPILQMEIVTVSSVSRFVSKTVLSVSFDYNF